MPKGQKIREYETVDIVVSNGKAPATATPEVAYSGMVQVDIPQTTEQTTIKIVSEGAVLFNKVCKKGDKTISQLITSTKREVNVEIYFDGSLSEVRTVTLR